METVINRRDMDMYYTGSILPVRHPTIQGKVTGAIIQSILGESPTGNYEDYSVFVKRCWIENGRYKEDGHAMLFRDFISDGLKKSHESLGYFKFQESRPIWLTGRPCISYKKGLTKSRLKGYTHLGEYLLDSVSTEDLASTMYNSFDGYLSKDFCIYQNRLLYKSRIIARISDLGCTLFQKFSYLQALVSQVTNLPVRVSND